MAEADPARRPARATVVRVLTLLVLVASVVSLVLALTRPDATSAAPPSTAEGTYDPASLAGPGGPALEAAVAALPTVLSYDHRDLRGSLRAARRTMTRDFAKEFAKSFDRRVKPFARKRNAVIDGVVRAAGLVRVRQDGRAGRRAVCLVYVDRRQLSGRQSPVDAPPQLLGGYRVLVTMVSRADGWKIDGIRPI